MSDSVQTFETTDEMHSITRNAMLALRRIDNEIENLHQEATIEAIEAARKIANTDPSIVGSNLILHFEKHDCIVYLIGATNENGLFTPISQEDRTGELIQRVLLEALQTVGSSKRFIGLSENGIRESVLTAHDIGDRMLLIEDDELYVLPLDPKSE